MIETGVEGRHTLPSHASNETVIKHTYRERLIIDRRTRIQFLHFTLLRRLSDRQRQTEASDGSPPRTVIHEAFMNEDDYKIEWGTAYVKERSSF